MAVTQTTTDVIRATAAEVVTTQKIFVQKIMWVGPVTAADKLVITNTAGTVLMEYQISTAEAGGTIDIDYHIKAARFDGMIITVLSSGKVDVYLE